MIEQTELIAWLETTGTVEIRNGPHVKKCGVCKGTGFFPITGL